METTRLKQREQDAQFEEYQSLLFPFAYNITGDYLASEDIVQEVISHHMLTDNREIINARHYLIRSVVNKAINQKQLLRTKMEQYPGRWLPVPMMTEDSIYRAADRDNILQYSLLVLMEQLNPKERAVFILKETFDFSHEEIAETLKIKPEHSRQLLKRSKEKIHVHNNSSHALDDTSRTLLTALANAILSADIDKAKSLLSNDVELVADGGPHVAASRNVLVGPDNVAKFLKAVFGKYFPAGSTQEFCEINHRPAMLFSLEGKIFRCMIFEIINDNISNVFIVVNPDKLQRLSLIKKPVT